MDSLLNIALLALASSGGENGGLLDVAPGLMIWTVVTFIILFFILKKLAWKPILTSLNERESYIKNSLEKAEKAKNEAEEILEKNKANLAEAEAEAQKIIEKGREYADNLKSQAEEAGKANAEKMIEAASSEIERKTQEAFNKLRGEVVEIAVKSAEKIIRENLDQDKQKKLVDKFIDDIQKN